MHVVSEGRRARLVRCKVHYVSPKGCAQALAEAIASEAKCHPEPLFPAYMPENLGLMFLGCEGSHADKITLEFIDSMSAARARNVALFCCSGNGQEAIREMRAALEKRGVRVLDESIAAPLKSLIRRGPSDQDLACARVFARHCVEAAGAGQ